MRSRYATVALALLALAAPALAVDMHGYFRQAVGGNTKGGDQQPFQNSGQGYKLRLANEDNWSEFLFEQQLAKDKNGAEWTAGFMVNWSGNGWSDSSALGFDISQEYIKAKFPQLGGATIWGGKRFYHRLANDIYDYFYVNESGPGTGIEDVNLGFAKLAVAVFKSQRGASAKDSDFGVTSPTFNGHAVGFWYSDVRLEGIEVAPGGWLDVGGLAKLRTWNEDYAGVAEPSDTQSISPFLFVNYTQTGIWNGRNNLGITYKTGCWLNDDCQEDRRRLTISDDLVLQPTQRLAVVLAGIYINEQRNVGGTKVTNDGWSVGVRPLVKLTDSFAIQGDAGYFYNKDDKNQDKANTMFKGTIAPTITPSVDAFPWAVRPEIRFYVTYAAWNKQQNGPTGFDGGAFGPTATNGTTFGAQVETWF